MKQKYSVILLLLVIFTFSCNEEESDKNTQGDKNIEINQGNSGGQYSSSALDSLNTLVKKYEENVKNLMSQNAELNEKINNSSDENVKVVYKTRSDTKKILKQLVEKKIQNLEQDSEIYTQKKIIEQNQRELNELRNKIEQLKSQSKPEESNTDVLTEAEITERIDSVIRKGLTVSDIDTKLYYAKENKKKSVELIEISFTINENQLAEKGNKVLYICITDSDGNILQYEGNDTFTRFGGYSKYYTLKNEFEYKGEKLRITIPWERKDQELSAGEYTIQFYIDNVLSGVSVFEIK